MGQDRAWSMVNACPHTQCVGSCGISQPYCKQRASRYAPLCRVKPYLSSGIVVRQLEAPVSVVNSTDLCGVVGNSAFSLVAAACRLLNLDIYASFFRCFSSTWISSCFTMC